MSFETAQIDLTVDCYGHRRRRSGLNPRDGIRAMDDSFRIKKPDRQFLVHSGSSHLDRDRFADQKSLPAETKHDLKRIFDGELVKDAGGAIICHVAMDAE